MITCIVATLGISLTFLPVDLPLVKETGSGQSWDKSKLVFFSLDSEENTWEFINEKGHIVTFQPECE